MLFHRVVGPNNDSGSLLNIGKLSLVAKNFAFNTHKMISIPLGFRGEGS